MSELRRGPADAEKFKTPGCVIQSSMESKGGDIDVLLSVKVKGSVMLT